MRTVCRTWGEPDYEDGWLGGMLDGEGSMPNSNHPGCGRIHVIQKKDDVFDRVLRYAARKSFYYGIENDETNPARPSKFGHEPCPRITFSRMDEVFQIVGQTRPSRFVRRRFWEDHEIPNSPFVTIEAIEPLGDRDVIDLQTTTGTYVAEGLTAKFSGANNQVSTSDFFVLPSRTANNIFGQATANHRPTSTELLETKAHLSRAAELNQAEA
jgi:hypothetical protein